MRAEVSSMLWFESTRALCYYVEEEEDRDGVVEEREREREPKGVIKRKMMTEKRHVGVSFCFLSLTSSSIHHSITSYDIVFIYLFALSVEF